MVRTQIQLADTTAKRLPTLANERGVSVAAFIREAVERRIAELDRERDDAWAAALAAIERGYGDREGATDLSEHHDDYIADDVYERKVAKTTKRIKR